MSKRYLVLLLALLLLSGCAPAPAEQTPPPALDEDALVSVFLDGAAADTTGRILAQADLGEQTVAVCLLRGGDGGLHTTLRAAAVDRFSGAPAGEILTLAQAEGYFEPWAGLTTEWGGVTVHYLEAHWEGDPATEHVRSGGGLRWDGASWSRLWPAGDDGTYWTDHDFQSFPDGRFPFRMWDETVPGEVTALLEQDLEERVLPGYEARGMDIWGYSMEPVLLGELPQPPGSDYSGPPEVWRLVYFLLSPDAPGSSKDGWFLEEAAPVVLMAPWTGAGGGSRLRLVHRFEDGGGSDDFFLLHAQELLLAQSPRSDGTVDGPVCPEGDRYDRDTGLFYSGALDMGLLVPEALRDLVVFRHETYGDGSAGLAILAAPLAARFEETGAGPDGVLGRVRALNEEQYTAYRASLSPERFPFGVEINCGSNVNPGQAAYLQGRYFIRDSNVQSWPLEELEDPALSALAWTAQDHAGELLASFYTGAWLPVDVDLSLALPRDESQEVCDRVAVGVTGDLPFGAPLTVEESQRFVQAPGDRWRKETWDGLTAVFYVDGETGVKTVTALSATGADWFTYRRGIGIGSAFQESWVCYGGQDYGYGLPQPRGQKEGDDPFRFYLTETEAGVPLPCTYWMEFQEGDGGQIVRITQYADLTGGQDPFS